ncbi:thioesterase [Jannaschia pagri]|uniref:Thioesterase n=1 Tax=Jannaschia pagri TaxID=2829797 RepID=A0ABQ4NPU3_9RHOB|nr:MULTISPECIES: PaaI family thioesterase [unclassified Jannaschia]GIT92268.1 thioesterase [Jannaschia sp. AI_61]GIT96102.1 thioesterase [Jannaschia sp. AI_62]
MTQATDTDAQAEQRDAAAQQFIAALPHCRALQMRVEEVSAGVAVLSMPWSEDLVGDPATGVVHGGAVSALMDTCGGAAVLCHPTAPLSTATMDLRIDYMRAAKPRQRITARATCHHVTRSVAFVRAEAFDEDGDGPVAVANGAFTLDRGSSA